ncbi:MAG: hypothetical protein RLZZ490_1799 [Cyanobacteriota bacterium]
MPEAEEIADNAHAHRPSKHCAKIARRGRNGDLLWVMGNVMKYGGNDRRLQNTTPFWVLVILLSSTLVALPHLLSTLPLLKRALEVLFRIRDNLNC